MRCLLLCGRIQRNLRFAHTRLPNRGIGSYAVRKHHLECDPKDLFAPISLAKNLFLRWIERVEMTARFPMSSHLRFLRYQTRWSKMSVFAPICFLKNVQHSERNETWQEHGLKNLTFNGSGFTVVIDTVTS